MYAVPTRANGLCEIKILPLFVWKILRTVKNDKKINKIAFLFQMAFKTVRTQTAASVYRARIVYTAWPHLIRWKFFCANSHHRPRHHSTIACGSLLKITPCRTTQPYPASTRGQAAVQMDECWCWLPLSSLTYQRLIKCNLRNLAV